MTKHTYITCDRCGATEPTKPTRDERTKPDDSFSHYEIWWTTAESTVRKSLDRHYCDKCEAVLQSLLAVGKVSGE